jgi:hypothetical protein
MTNHPRFVFVQQGKGWAIYRQETDASVGTIELRDDKYVAHLEDGTFTSESLNELAYFMQTQAEALRRSNFGKGLDTKKKK